MTPAYTRSIVRKATFEEIQLLCEFREWCRSKWSCEPFVCIGSELATGGLALVEVSLDALDGDQLEDAVLSAAEYIRKANDQVAANEDH